MNLKLNGLILFIGIGLGVWITHKFTSKEQPVVNTVFTEKKSGNIKRKIHADGSIDEIEIFQSERKQAITLKKEDNLFFIADKRSGEVVLKLDHILLGIGYSPEQKEILYKLGYSTRIF